MYIKVLYVRYALNVFVFFHVILFGTNVTFSRKGDLFSERFDHQFFQFTPKVRNQIE